MILGGLVTGSKKGLYENLINLAMFADPQQPEVEYLWTAHNVH